MGFVCHVSFVISTDQITNVYFSFFLLMFLVPPSKYFVKNCIIHAHCMGS